MNIDDLKREYWDLIAENYGDDSTHTCIITDVIDHLHAKGLLRTEPEGAGDDDLRNKIHVVRSEHGTNQCTVQGCTWLGEICERAALSAPVTPAEDVMAALNDSMMVDDLSCWAHDHIKTILALLTAHTDSPAISSDGTVPLRTQSGVPDEPVDVQERG